MSVFAAHHQNTSVKQQNFLQATCNKAKFIYQMYMCSSNRRKFYLKILSIEGYPLKYAQTYISPMGS